MTKNYWIFALLIILFLGFYWFQLRPSNIRQSCHDEAFIISFEYITQNKIPDVEQRRITQDKEYTRTYNLCLDAHGLQK